MNKILLSFSLIAFGTGCSVASEDPNEGAVASQSEAISQGALTNWNPTAVRIRLGKTVNEGKHCSALALNRRWILTAAHCVVDAPNGKPQADAIRVQYTNQDLERVYAYGEDGYESATFYKYPGWEETGKREYDMALIVLAARGLSGDIGQTNLFWDDSQPWDIGSNSFAGFSAAGYGRGSDPDSGIICDDDDTTSGFKRLGSFEFERLESQHFDESLAIRVKTPNQQDLCNGDSGAPYFLVRGRGGTPYNFALHQGTWGDEDGGREFGVLIRPKWTWISTTVGVVGVPLSCPMSETSFGMKYRRCAW